MRGTVDWEGDAMPNRNAVAAVTVLSTAAENTVTFSVTVPVTGSSWETRS